MVNNRLLGTAKTARPNPLLVTTLRERFQKNEMDKGKISRRRKTEEKKWKKDDTG